MFTGIIEKLGKIRYIDSENSNINFTVESCLSQFLKVDQSIAINGVCLTVTSKSDKTLCVTAIKETLNKTNLSLLNVGDFVNLERAMVIGSRIDGHLIQGHVDQIGICTKVKNLKGSWCFYFKYDFNPLQNITINKGSIAINGVSLTVCNSNPGSFEVNIIPYTFENTTFFNIRENDSVNIEFDMIGKYITSTYKNYSK